MFKISLTITGEKNISGDHLFVLLDYIMLYGSISRAATQVGVSYRYAWGVLQEAEKALNMLLVEKQAGGYAGGGAILTPEGKWMLKEYKNLRTNTEQNLELFLARTGRFKDARPSVEQVPPEKPKYLLLASTMEPIETGLLDELENAFFHERGILIRHLAAGSGKALEIARGGRVDMVLTHAPALEEEFMAEGWGVYQYPVMTNDFVIAGPASDPAGIEQLSHAAPVKEVFRRIGESEAPYVSRDDHSGTHLREVELWEQAGITPGGKWYLLYPGVAGNLGALRFAREKKAYILTDRASYCIYDNRDDYRVFIENDKTEMQELKNTFVLTLINPEKVSSSRLEEAILFARWLQREKGSKIIENFGRKTYRRPLFKVLRPARAEA